MNCEQASLYYYDYLEKTGTVDPEAAAHLDHCPACRSELDRLRQALQEAGRVEKPWRPKYLELHYQFLDQWVGCDEIRPLLPALLLAQPLSVAGPTPVTAHVDRCPVCRQALDDIASLGLSAAALLQAGRYLADDTIEAKDLNEPARAALDAVRNSRRSTVLTRMRLREAAQMHLSSQSYTVDVNHRPIPAIPAVHKPHRRAVSAWVAGGVAAAVLFAILLVLPAGDVHALDIDQLYMTLDTVRNVHIQKFDETRKLESIWVSEGLGAYLFEQPESVVFVNKKTGNIYRQHQGAVHVVSRGGEMDLARPWGLLPFRNIADVPASYEWEQVGDSEMENGVPVRIYEWRWTETISDRLAIQHIWRGYLDTRSYLPYRVESLDKVGDAPAELIMKMHIRYPSDEECRRIFEMYGFEGLVYGIQDEAFKTVPSPSNVGSTAAGLVLSTWPSAKTALKVPEK